MKVFNLKAALPILAAVVFLAPAAPYAHARPEPPSVPAGGFLPAVQQTLDPTGTQVDLPGFRPQALALSPDGKLLATTGKTNELVLLDPATGAILQRVRLPLEKSGAEAADAVSPNILIPDKDAQLSFTGLIFSADGKRLYLSNVNGSVKVFAVDDAHKVTGIGSIVLPASGIKERNQEVPSGLAISADGQKLYVVLNLSNRLLELDLATGRPLRFFDVGVAPFDVVLSGKLAFVSNWGGRRPGAGDLVGPAGRGTTVRVDPVRHIANEGSVSVIDLTTGTAGPEIMVGLHPSAMVLTPDGKHVCVANSASDCISVISTKTRQVEETISLKWTPGDFFGASPNALTISRDGKTLYVCNGTQNAVAVIGLKPGKSEMLGLIPVGWYPGAVIEDARRRQLYVANVKGGIPAHREKYNSHEWLGSVSLVPIPKPKELERQTALALRDYRHEIAQQALLPVRPGIAAKPVPERIGEPSVFRHVIYIIKENRTYDQILGDIKEGNGNAELCVFGDQITPNQHKIAREFALLDNTYCSSILSADGHQWATTAMATDYVEREFAGFPRSYPDGVGRGGYDALAYSPAGFIWDNALAHGLTFRDYGEFAAGIVRWKKPGNSRGPRFKEIYDDCVNQTGLLEITCQPGIASIGPYLATNSIGWDLNVPDIYRAAKFSLDIHELQRTNGELPRFVILYLPNDHTSGTRAGGPTPRAQIADNDMAMGRVLEAVSHSVFWKDTCIFAIEDDPQSGWDHVSGYRTTAYVASPYTKRHAVVSTAYNQPGMLRTMELILGLPPMTQMDASATPMFDCFTDKPNLTPFDAVKNNIPLDELNPRTASIQDRTLRKLAIASEKLPLDKPDQCPEVLMNQIIWASVKGSKVPYPFWAAATKDVD